MKAYPPLVLFLLFFASGCKEEIHSVSRPMLGTMINISIISDSQSAALASDAVFTEINRIEELMSPFKKASDIYRINIGSGRALVKVSAETLDLLDLSLQISAESGGAFDPSFASMSRLWNFSSPDFVPPSSEAVKKLLPLVDYRKIVIDRNRSAVKFKEGMKIGLGGIAKGYAVKRGVQVLKELGIKSAIVEEGGDLQVIGSKRGKKWRCGLRQPGESSMAGVFLMDDMDSVATSGNYERFAEYRGKRYHHIIDPATGFPTETFASVSVLSKDPVISDACATAIFVLGPERVRGFLKGRPEIGAVMITPEGKISATVNIKSKTEFFGSPTVEWID